MKRILIFIGMVVLTLNLHGQKLSEMVADGDTSNVVDKDSWFYVAELDGNKVGKAIRLHPLFMEKTDTPQFDKIYIGTTGAYFTGDSLVFANGISLTVRGDTLVANDNTISELPLLWMKLAYNAAVRDAVSPEGVLYMKKDTVTKISWVFTDSAQFHTDRWMAWYKNTGPDTIAITASTATVPDGSPDFSYNWCVNDSISFTGDYTQVWTSNLLVSGSDATSTGEYDDSPNNPSVPPGYYIMLWVPLANTPPENGCEFNLECYEY